MLDAAVEFLVGEFAKGVLRQGWMYGKARQKRRRTEAAVIARDLEELRTAEFADLSANDWSAAQETLIAAVRATPSLDVDAVAAADGDDVKIAAIVRRHGAGVIAAARLEPGTREAFDRLLDETARRVVDLVTAEPDFAPVALRKLMARLRLVEEKVGDRAAPTTPEPGADFADRYTEYLARAFGKFDLYGIDLVRPYRRQNVLETYVSLAVTRADTGPGDELTGAGVPAGPTIAADRRAVVRGGAGTGKSTLLRRYLVAAALGDEDYWFPDGPLVPFLVELRHAGELPAADGLVALTAPALRAAEPDGWADRVLREGRGAILVDGIDEVEPDRRDEVRSWLLDLGRAYPAARIVATTRQGATPRGWWSEGGFTVYDLQALTAESVRTFVERWHVAYTAELEPDEIDRYDERRDRLMRAFERRSELRELMRVPLLCGLVCLLSHHDNASLPRNRFDLYERALRLLLVEWDEQRDVRQDDPPPLDRDEQRVLLERIAQSLVIDEHDGLGRDDALVRITAQTRGMGSRPRSSADPDTVATWAADVLAWLIERSSLLREPGPDLVEFTHSTFRDYLAAAEFVATAQFDVLVRNAHQVRWRDVVVMAMNFARPPERVRLLRELLTGNEAARRDPAVLQQLHFVAATCLRESPSVLDQESGDAIREEILAMLRRWIPPSDREEAELLGRAGSVALDLLPGPEAVLDRHRPFVAHTLAMIGGPVALARLADLGPSQHPEVADGLLNAWRGADDPAEYARTVLAGVDFGDRPVHVRSEERIRNLSHLRGVRNVVCVGDGDPVGAIAGLATVHTLTVLRNDTLASLEPLRGNRTLRRLVLRQCHALRALDALRDAAVEELEVVDCLRVDLGGLRGSGVRRLHLGRGPRSLLRRLPEELPALTELSLDETPDGELARRLADAGVAVEIREPGHRRRREDVDEEPRALRQGP